MVWTMKKINWNQDWSYRKLDSNEEFRAITLPYDCMLHEKRSDDAEGGCNNGWFEGYDYELVKRFQWQPEAHDRHIFLAFEAIFHHAEIWCNGEKLAERPNGYLGMTVEITPLLKAGENQVRVIARGADVPCERWYTGVGIYRPVWLYEAPEAYVKLDSIRMETISIAPTAVRVSFETSQAGKAQICLMKNGEKATEATSDNTAVHQVVLNVPQAQLWSPQQPEMYQCVIRFGQDTATENVGIRMIQCTPEKGFCINGKREILRGACIHHDNGLLGAASFPEAEERKVQLLRAMGYNAIRSAHNPCGKTLLDVCDRLGMMVMDEYADSWYIHKTKYDYAPHVQQWYARDLTDMVAKDYNHPCVVLYSLGNEVTESAEEKGVALFCKMRDTLKRMDSTRPVTCGINIGFNQAAAMGHSFFSDEKAMKNDFRNMGTEKANHRKWMLGPLLTRLNALMPGCDRATRDIFAASDVAGYNYGILRYRWDRFKYPKRVILGSESFCHDTARFWRIAQKDTGIIGDFVWTGIDHLGEVGLGAWEYKDYAPTYIHTKGWLTSGAGRADITGKLLPEAYFVKAAFGQLTKPMIAVVPPNHAGERHSPSGWKMTNAVSSWAWEGCEGRPAKVEVYACGAYVDLFLNSRKIGRRRLGRGCRVHFTLPYQQGQLTAIVYDRHHREISRNCLTSAEKETVLRLEAEENRAESGKLVYIRLRLSDRKGVTKVLERRKIRVTVEGGELLGLGHACPYNEEGYVSSETSTYYGEALAIVRAGKPGKLRIHAVMPDGGCDAEIDVV